MSAGEIAATQVTAQRAQRRVRQQGPQPQPEQRAHAAESGRFGDQHPRDLGARGPEHPEQGELRPARDHRLRLQ